MTAPAPDTHALHSSSSSPVPNSSRPRLDPWRAWFNKLWAPALLVLIPLGVLVPVVGSHNAAMSPVDEWVYYDYIHRIPEDPAVEAGETVGYEARERMSCHGVVPYGPMGPSCGGDYSDARQYPYDGVNSASGYTPVFFYVTWVGAQALKAVSGVELLTAARLTSIGWLIAGLLLFYVLARRFNVSKWMIVAVATAFVASPHSWWTFTYLTTDSSSFAMGAALLLLADRYRSGETRAWPLIAVAGLASALKITNLLAVGLVVLILLAAWWRDHRSRHGGESVAWRRLFVLGSVAAAALIVQLLWRVYGALAGSSSGDGDQGITTSLNLGELRRVFIETVPGAAVYNPQIQGAPLGQFVLPVPHELTQPMVWIVVLGVLGPAFTMLKGKYSDWAWPVAIAAFVGPAALAVVLHFTIGYFQLPERYGASLLPAAFLGFAVLARSKAATVLTAAYALVLINWIFGYISSPGHI